MKKRAIGAGIGVLAVICAFVARPDITSGSPATTVIHSATVIVNAPEHVVYLTISGQNFPTSDPPVVMLAGEFPVAVQSYSLTEIVGHAVLLTPGNYRLDVEDLHGRGDNFVVTIVPYY